MNERIHVATGQISSSDIGNSYCQASQTTRVRLCLASWYAAEKIIKSDYYFVADISVCPDTEISIYNDAFFEKLDIVVNALDNLEARRYMDRWRKTIGLICNIFIFLDLFL